jgi:3-oxoadipate enol-lactonase
MPVPNSQCAGAKGKKMPIFLRTPHLTLSYAFDDFTDPWDERPFLLLQHGNGRNGGFWYRWIPCLARRFRIIRPDMRGLGQSVGALDLGRDITLEALIGDLLAVLDHAGADRVHFCGESMGGILGLVLAAQHPARVQTLTLVSTPVFIEEQMKTRYSLGHGSRTEAMEAMGIREWVAATTRVTRLPADEEPGLFNWYVDEFAKGDPAVQVAMSHLVNGANAADFLPKVKQPVLGLYPTAGQITSAAQEALLQEKLPQLEMLHLPTGYHMVQLLFPELCTKALTAFCEAHS